MFEKETEEIVNKKLCAKMMCYGHCSFSSPKHHRCGDWHKCYEIAKECAEFGYNKGNDQLTKAKELLKNFVALDKDMDWNLQLAYDAEQFISEVEK